MSVFEFYEGGNVEMLGYLLAVPCFDQGYTSSEASLYKCRERSKTGQGSVGQDGRDDAFKECLGN